jgi:hypothetical protein
MLNFNWLSGVTPEQAKWIFLGLFILIGLLVLLIPRDYIFEGVPKEERYWYMNLKLWAWVVLGILFYTYYIF